MPPSLRQRRVSWKYFRIDGDGFFPENDCVRILSIGDFGT
jgi:hypothetical protein